MGQVERYGLYVLVLFIFLILGVAIWGEDPSQNAHAANTRVAADRSTTPERDRAGRDRDSDSTLIEDLGTARNRALLSNFEIDEFDDELIDSPEDVPEDDPSNGDVEERNGPSGQRQSTRVDPVDPPRRDDVAPPSLREYKIRPGDTLSEISKRELGSAAPKAWKRILALNPDLSANRLPTGRTIKLPAREAAVERYRTASRGLQAGERLYVVRRGDSLSTIASRELGTIRHVKAIMDRNALSDPSKLRAGRSIVLPDVSQARND